MKHNKFKAQVFLGSEAAIQIYKLLRHGSRGKAIEQGLLMLAKDKHLREHFFDDYELEQVDKILAQRDKKNLLPADKQHSVEAIPENVQENQTNEQNDQVKVEW